MTSSRRHEKPYDTHPWEMINHTKFDVCTLVVSKELKCKYVCTNVQTKPGFKC